MKLACFVVAALGLASSPVSAGSKAEKALAKFYAMSDAEAASKVGLKDDQLEAIATFSTEPLLQVRQGLLGLVNQDSYLRAFVNKQSGDVSYQIVAYYRHGGDWAHLRSANYQTFSGQLRTVEVVNLGTDVSCSGYAGCTYFEAAGFTIDPDAFAEEVQNADATASGGQRSGMLFKIKGVAGELPDAIPGKEFRALDSAVRSYRSSRGL